MKMWRSSLTAVATISMVSLGLVGGASASAADNVPTSRSSCVAATPTHVGKIAGLQAPQSVSGAFAAKCAAPTSGGVKATPPYYFYNNVPLPYGGGPVMDTTPTPVTITPIYWAPSTYSFAPTYQSITDQFIKDIAAASGSSTDFLSVLTQYFNDTSSTPILNNFTAGTPIIDSDAYQVPGSGTGCSADNGPVYADGSLNTSCVTDAEIEAELAHLNVTSDQSHIYVVYLPKGVEECFMSSNLNEGGQCSGVSATPAISGQFCGYHSFSGSTVSSATIYAVLPYAVADGQQYTCSSSAGGYSDGTGVGDQTPNGNIDADTEVSITSHEISESVTDPFPVSGEYGWIDTSDNEVGDDCAYVYGDSLAFGGSPGAEYNQTINGDHYFIQEEFSNYQNQNNSNYRCALMSDQSILFDPNGGVGVMAPQNEALNTVAPISPNTFTRPGYTFTGWNSMANGSGTTYANNSNVQFTTSATLYAQWTSASFTVTFNANGGTGSMASESSPGPALLTTNTFTRAGYTFLGWYGVVSGVGGIYYGDGASYSFRWSITLYAQWEIQAPSAPLSLTAHVKGSSLTLNWTAPTSGNPPDGYLMYEGSTSGTESAAPLNFDVPIPGQSFVITGVTPGETYSFYVTSENIDGSSPHSNEVVVTVPRGKTLTKLTISPATVAHQRAKLVDFRVKVLLPGTGPVHGGAVRILSGSKLLCSLTLSKSGTGSCHVNSSRLKSGHDSVTAVYAGNSSDRGSKSSTRTIAVT